MDFVAEFGLGLTGKLGREWVVGLNCNRLLELVVLKVGGGGRMIV